MNAKKSFVDTSTGDIPVVAEVSVTQKRRRMLAAIVDGLSWSFGVVLAVALRFEFIMDARGWISTTVLALIAGAIQIVIGYATGLYRGRFTYVSFDVVRAVGVIVGFEAVALTLGEKFWWPRKVTGEA